MRKTGRINCKEVPWSCGFGQRKISVSYGVLISLLERHSALLRLCTNEGRTGYSVYVCDRNTKHRGHTLREEFQYHIIKAEQKKIRKVELIVQTRLLCPSLIIKCCRISKDTATAFSDRMTTFGRWPFTWSGILLRLFCIHHVTFQMNTMRILFDKQSYTKNLLRKRYPPRRRIEQFREKGLCPNV